MTLTQRQPIFLRVPLHYPVSGAELDARKQLPTCGEISRVIVRGDNMAWMRAGGWLWDRGDNEQFAQIGDLKKFDREHELQVQKKYLGR